ncbi:Indoleacetamide hydrolase [Cupriavidus sp. H18C1]
MSDQNQLTSLSAVELRRLIGARQISPVELLEACIARIERYNPLINAITATCYERAREEARAAEQAVMRGDTLGLLHGLPLGVKDLEATAGLLTTYGSPLYRGNVPAQDNTLVARLRQAGAVVVGKTNIPEMGAGANSRNAVWGATGNPFNPNLNAGGSSGGSAAALAADFLPVCTGSDTGGSLRIPAAKCGVVGFRPSPGLVPNSRKLLGWTPISVVGPMGRTVADACLQLAASAGESAGDPLSHAVDPLAFLTPARVDLSGLRVGWTEDFGSCAVDADIRRVFRARIAAMRHLFKSCDEVAFDLGDVHRCFDVLRAESFVASLRDTYERDPDSLGPNTRANYEIGARMSLVDSAWAQAEQTRIFQRFQQAFRDYDVILSPTTPVSPFPLDHALRGRRRGGETGELLPLAGADLCGDADHPSLHRLALRHRRGRHALRPADHRPVPRRCTDARRGAGDGIGVCIDARLVAPEAGSRQADAGRAGIAVDCYGAAGGGWRQRVQLGEVSAV